MIFMGDILILNSLQVITFEKVKVTNNESDNTGQVRKHNFHSFLSTFTNQNILRHLTRITTIKCQNHLKVL